MSILLDALKKSEEQRQMGTAPGIHSNPDHRPSGGTRGAPAWVPIALVLLAVLIISWLGWQQYREPDTLAGMPAAKTDSEVASSAEAARQAAPQKAEQALEQSDATRTPVESFARTEAGPADSEDVDQRRETLKQSFNTYQPEPGSDEEVAPSAAAEAGAVDSSAEPELAEQRINSGEPVQPAEADQGDRPAALEPHESRPISYWELPQSVRDGLPEIRISVLVYAEKPENRFALINGQRMVESDELSSGVVLHEIRREGAVFTYRKYRFLVKG